MIRKNVAGQFVGVQMVNATTGAAFTGAVTVYVTGDAGTQAIGSVGSGACTHEGNGYHTYAPATAETNYNIIAFTFIGTGAVPVTVQILTVSFNPHDTVRLGVTALPNAAAEASGGLPTLSAAQASNGTVNVNVHRWLTGTPNALQSGRVDGYLGAVASGVIAAASFAANALDAVWSTTTRVLTAATNLTTALATPTNITAGTITTVTTLTNPPSDSSGITTLLGKLTGITVLANWLGAMAGKQTANATALTEINATGAGSGTYAATTDSLEAVRDRGDAAWATATGFSTLDAAGVRTAVGLASANLDTQLGAIDTVVDAVLVDTAEIGAAGAGLTALASAANLATVAGYLDTEIAAILADTNELQTDWANNGRLDLILDARASQTSVDDLPTNAELATSQAAADDATLAAIAALDGKVGTVTNLGSGATLAANLVDIEAQTDDIGAAGAGLTALATAAELAKVPKSDGTATWNATALASLQAEATDALNAYDPPTNAGMVARTLVAASYATAAALQVVDDELAVVDTVADAILADTGTDGVIVATVNDKTGYALGAGGISSAAFAAGAIDAAALNADAVDEILDEQIGDSTITMRQALKILVASLSGKLSGVGTGTITIRNAADTADVIVATVSGGNRTAVTRSL